MIYLCCILTAAAAVANSLQLCLTLCYPIDGSPPGSPVPGILQAKNTGVGCHFPLQCMKVKSEREVALVSNSLRPHGPQPTRLLCPWDFPGKSTGVGCHRLLRTKVLRPFNEERIVSSKIDPGKTDYPHAKELSWTFDSNHIQK